MNLIFLLSINRSGSTLILNELSKSPDIMVCPEADCLVNILLTNQNKQISPGDLQRIKRKLAHDPKFTSWAMPISTIQMSKSEMTYFDVFVLILTKYLNRIKPGARMIIFRAERLFQLVNELNQENINKYEIQIICLIRDIRAVYASQKNTIDPDSGRRMSQNPVRTTKYWRWYIESMKRSSRLHWELIRFEDFITKYDQIIIQLFNLLGASEEILKSTGDLFGRLPETHKKIHKNCNKKPLVSRIDAWQYSLSIYEVYCIESMEGNTLKEFHYELLSPSVNCIILFALQFKWYFFYFMGRVFRNVRYSLMRKIHA